LFKLFLELHIVLVVSSPLNHIGCISHFTPLISRIKVSRRHLVSLFISHE